MKNALLLLLCLSGCAHVDVVNDAFPDKQAQVRKRLDEIWAAAAKRDLDRLASFHLYSPKFTEFKDGQARADAAVGAAKEKGFFSAAEAPTVDMKDLKVDVFNDTAVATFNGHFTATMEGHPIAADMGVTLVFVEADGDWKIVHEHFSPIGSPPAAGR